MHRRPAAELLPLDTEIEKTLRNLKKVRATEEATMAEQKESNKKKKKNSYSNTRRTSIEAENHRGLLQISD